MKEPLLYFFGSVLIATPSAYAVETIRTTIPMEQAEAEALAVELFAENIPVEKTPCFHPDEGWGVCLQPLSEGGEGPFQASTGIVALEPRRIQPRPIETLDDTQWHERLRRSLGMGAPPLGSQYLMTFTRHRSDGLWTHLYCVSSGLTRLDVEGPNGPSWSLTASEDVGKYYAPTEPPQLVSLQRARERLSRFSAAHLWPVHLSLLQGGKIILGTVEVFEDVLPSGGGLVAIEATENAAESFMTSYTLWFDPQRDRFVATTTKDLGTGPQWLYQGQRNSQLGIKLPERTVVKRTGEVLDIYELRSLIEQPTLPEDWFEKGLK